MPIINDTLVEIVLDQMFFGQNMLNVFQYEVHPPTGAIDPVSLGNAWWNDIKASMRAFALAGGAGVFRSVKVRELNNPTGDYGEYAIPAGESSGTRSAPEQANALPIFNAASLRLVVGTRTTRPGHKRVGYLLEEDNSGGVLGSAFQVLMASFGVIVSNDMTLGVPALLTVLNPIICRKDATGAVTAHQPVTGFIVNTNITSQNTRKPGRGV